MKNKKQKGYTLLEILVIVVIIGILASVSVPIYNKVINKSEVSDALHKIDMFSGAQGKYFIQNGSYTGDLSNLETPLKGNSSNISTANFNYYAGDPGEGNYCIYSESTTKDYTLARNYRDNSEILCSGNDCDKVSSFVKTGSLAALCGSAVNDNCDLNCSFPKVLDNSNGNCKCVCDSSLCKSPLATQDSETCQCYCLKPFTYITETHTCICPDSVKKECEDLGKDFDPSICGCVDGGSGCNKTEESCKDENENWTLLEGCTCGCPETEECQGNKIWNSTRCECEEQSSCDKTEESCKDENENWTLLEGCTCGCPKIETCEGGQKWNPELCKCESSCDKTEEDCNLLQHLDDCECKCTDEAIQQCAEDKNKQLTSDCDCRCKSNGYCEDPAQTFNPDTCQCECVHPHEECAGYDEATCTCPGCKKTDAECKAINPNWRVLKNCTCGCVYKAVCDDPGQYWDEETCSCAGCTKTQADCSAMGINYAFDENACACYCILTTSLCAGLNGGMVFNQEDCSCTSFKI